MKITRKSKVSKLYQKIAKIYVKEYWGKSTPYDKYIDKFLLYLPKSAKILDVGCGAGDSVALFLERGYKAEGVDISKDMIEIARQKVPRAKFGIMDIRSLKYSAKSFDAVYCYGALEHVPKKDIPKTLKGFARIMKYNGFLFINPPKGNGEHEIYYPLAKQRFRASHYTVKEIKNLLSKCGFKILFYKVAPPFFRRGTRYHIIFTIARKIE